jgi:hypothetical protein
LALLNLTDRRGVAVIVGELGGLGLPVLGSWALDDGGLLRLLIVLLQRGDEAGVDDLSAHRDLARRARRRVKPLEQRLDGAGSRQLLPEQPDLRALREPGLTAPSPETALIRNSARSSESVSAA